jgi:hypothetical protein
MTYALVTLLILSCLLNFYLVKALGRELIRRSQLEEGVLALKIEKDFERHMNSRYTNEREPGGNLQ